MLPDISSSRTSRPASRIDPPVVTRSPAGSGLPHRRLRAVLLVAGSVVAASVLATIGLLVAPRAQGSDVQTTPVGATAPGGAGLQAPAVGIRTFVAPGGLRTRLNVTYATATHGAPLTLDVCSPATKRAASPAVLLIHGGGWTHGDKAGPDYHAVCEWLAFEGFVTFSADYTLGEQGRFPVAPDELRSAVAWMRSPGTVQRYGIDPRHIGFVGGSAGGSMAALLATEGSGPTDTGTRAAALVEISGPVDLTARGQGLGHPGPGLQSFELGYLGCTTFESCPQAATASAVTHIDPSDPPTFIQGSEGDFVPHEQGEEFAAALEAAGVPHVSRIVPGSQHSIAQLDAASRSAIAAFLHRYLG